MEKVELHPAHVWDCPECGRENFCRGIVAEMSEEEREDMREQTDASDDDPWMQTGFWMTTPEQVTCAHCGAEFETEDYEHEVD